MAFPQFSRLPMEIRLEIWRQCLPNRVVELDEPANHILSATEPDYYCPSSHTAFINRSPPVISRVCHESRMVALEHVNLLPDDVDLDYPDFGTSVGIVDWVDKRRDVLHIHYDSSYEADWPTDTSQGEPIQFFLSEAATRARDASVTKSMFTDITEDAQINAFRKKSLLICLRVVSIHAPLRPALDSGLFGLLGDARVVLVDPADKGQMKQYRAFWETHGMSADMYPHPARFFDEFDQHDDTWVQKTVEKLNIHWLLHQWFQVKDQVSSEETVWLKTPKLDTDWENEPWLQQHWIPNPEHWWMRDALASAPKLRARVMFRLCTQRCPENDEYRQRAVVA